jgi:endonuclease-3
MAKTPAKSPSRAKPKATAAPNPFPFELPPVTAAQKRRAGEIAAALAAAYPHARCELDYKNPHELLVATILSAQATDVGVNKATPALFKRFPTPADYAASSPEEIQPYIKTIGLFRNKSKAIHAAMKDIVEKFDGKVPSNMEDLLTLRGVARKTANVVLGNAFHLNMGFVVDTHIERVSKRFGLVENDTPIPKIERKLMALFPRNNWCDLSHQFIFHGRYSCKARGVTCDMNPICKKFGVACELKNKEA